jgi:serine/threonine protein kinase
MIPVSQCSYYPLSLLISLVLPPRFVSVQSHAPTATVSRYDGNRFWVDSSIQMALATIMSYGIYSARVVDMSEGEDGGLICVEETVPPINTPVPVYIGQQDVYTEKECRDICRKLAECINILHNTGIAHRNLHIENVIVDPWVSPPVDCSVKINSPSYFRFSHTR